MTTKYKFQQEYGNPTIAGRRRPASVGAGGSRRGTSGAPQQVPPTGNTGAPLHPQAGLDWLDFTVRVLDTCDRDYALHRLGELFMGLTRLERNMHGYTRVFACLSGYGFVMYNHERLDMGVHVSLSSSALAEFSSLYPESSQYRILTEARSIGCRFTRIDICFDTPDVHIDMVVDAVNRGELVTPARKVTLMQDMIGDNPGKTVYIGAPTSERRVRIYDKAAEQDVSGVWTRFETQYRKAYADSIVDYILHSDVSMEVLVSTSFDFRELGNTRTNNRARSAWFQAILGAFEKVELTVTKAARTLKDKAEWFLQQQSRTLAVLWMAFGSSFIDTVLEVGVIRATQIDMMQVSSTKV